MKKLLIGIAVLSLVLAGCGIQTTKITSPATSSTSNTSASLGVMMRGGKMVTIAKDHTTSSLASDAKMANGLTVSNTGKLSLPTLKAKSAIETDNGITIDQLVDNDIVASDGTVLFQTGAVLLPDYTFVDYGGNVYLKDGTLIDSAVTLPNERVIWDNGDITSVSGTFDTKTLQSGEKTTLEDGTETSYDGTTQTVKTKDGTLIVIGKSVTLPDGTVISTADARVTLPNGVVTDPIGGMMLKDGTVISVDSVL